MKLRRWCYAVVCIALCYCCLLFMSVAILDTERGREGNLVRHGRDHPWEHTHQPHSAPSCPPPPSHCHTNPRTVLIVGALHAVGAWLAAQLAGSSWSVRTIALETDISTQPLLWYRRDQLSGAGVKVEFRNFSNSSQVAAVGEWSPSHVVFVPAGLEVDDDATPLDSAHWGSQMRALVALLEMLSCGEFVLVSRSLGHMTISQAHMTSLEAALIAYHNTHNIRYTILRTESVYGPWTQHSLSALHSTSDPAPSLERSWYINDLTSSIISVISRPPFCHQLDLSPCPEEPTLHDTHSLLNLSSPQPVGKGLKKTLHWARAYQKQLEEGRDDVIMTSYFTSTHDFQRNKSMSPDRVRYMLDWLVSVRDLGLRAVVFHDELSPSFQQRVSQFHPGISFRHVTAPLNRTTNDARFYAYLSYLRTQRDHTHILLTDISDVRLQQNPFQLMRLLGNRLYVGTDIEIFPNMASQRWISEKLEACFGNHTPSHAPLRQLMYQETVFNAGVVGGPRNVVLAFLERVTQYLDTTPPSLNCNMAAVNIVVHRYFHSQLFTGFPLTSRFLAFQQSPKGAYIIHK